MTTFADGELFYRELAEVHLLIDFISGRADKSLSGLAGVAVEVDGQAGAKPLTAQQVIEDVCLIAYPAEGGPQATAKQAAFMLMVKDRLNYLAQPARGLTVAFTSMFTGISPVSDLLHQITGLRSASRARAAAARRDQFEGNGGGSRGSGGSDGRPTFGPGGRPPTFFSAREAYPSLEREARSFRNFFSNLPRWAFFLVALIVYINWDVSITSSLLQQISAANTDYQKLFDTNQAFVPTADQCSALKVSLSRPGAATVARTSPTRSRSTRANTTVRAKANETAPSVQLSAEALLIAQQKCAAAAEVFARQAATQQNLQNLLWGHPVWQLWHPVALGVWLFDAPVTQPQASDPKMHSSPVSGVSSRPSQIEAVTLAVVSGLNNIVVPALFGLLGTMVSVLRSITTKVRDSVLAPRDYRIARISMFLGLSAGLTVGLIYNPVTGGEAIAKGLGGTISVSAATLSFLAGVGAEAFFTFLDGVIGRLFPQAQPTSPTVGKPSA